MMVSDHEPTEESNDSLEYGWAHWDTAPSEDLGEGQRLPAFFGNKSPALPEQPAAILSFETSLPPQLHPAVSMGVRRMSSCYFSIGSEGSEVNNKNSMADLLSLWEAEERKAGSVGLDIDDSPCKTTTSTSEHNTESNPSLSPNRNTSAASHQPQLLPSDLLYHDILMNVFTFCDAESLAAFSETARRPNFECFYFLQLQLQRALLVWKNDNDDNSPTPDNQEDPLSAIAGVGAIRRLAALDRPQAEQTVQDFLDSNSTLSTMPLSHSLAYIRQILRRHNLIDDTKNSMASAALLITVLGAASSFSPDFSFGAELLPNMLFRVGFVGSLMGAASLSATTTQHHDSSSSNENVTMRQRAEAAMRAAYTAAYGLEQEDSPEEEEQPPQQQQPQTPNPYEHLQQPQSPQTVPDDDRKLPSGCVGAYSRAVARASEAVTHIIKERRRLKFRSLPENQQQQLSTTFIDACCSDETLHIVREMLQEQETIDVEGFYVGSDGTKTCALHASAFHGSHQTLEFLCRGLLDHAQHDGGLGNVNGKDENGWTAMHFAAGANSVEAVRILVAHGADVSLEAMNGYTPLQWAERLQNAEVAEELRQQEAEGGGWMSRKPLSMIASRFFAMIPSH